MHLKFFVNSILIVLYITQHSCRLISASELCFWVVFLKIQKLYVEASYVCIAKLHMYICLVSFFKNNIITLPCNLHNKHIVKLYANFHHCFFSLSTRQVFVCLFILGTCTGKSAQTNK